MQRAIACYQSKDLAGAAEACNAVLALAPHHADARHVLGLVEFARGNTETAIEQLLLAVTANPTAADFHFNLGQVFERAKRYDEALAAYRRACEVEPARPTAHFRLGRLLGVLRQWREAIAPLMAAARLDPRNARIWFSLGLSQYHAGDPAAAEASYRTCLSVEPDDYPATLNLGVMLLQQGKVEAAIEMLERARALRPDQTEPLVNLGAAHLRAGRIDAAVKVLTLALPLPNGLDAVAGNLAGALTDQARHREAMELLHQAIANDPPPAEATWHNYLFSMHYAPDFDPALAAAEHKRWGAKVAAIVRRDARPFANTRDPEKRLVLGFVSPDFYTHPVATFIGPLFDGLDRNRFGIVGFAQQTVRDETTDRLMARADRWIEIQHLADQAAINAARALPVDVLIDLAGHTSGNRLGIFARRAAPVQATYLGYPGTTGLVEIDYRLTDAWADPVGVSEAYYSERLYRLPQGFLCYRPPAATPAVAPTPAASKGYVTFGSFNNLPKLTDRTIADWSNILRRVPGSRLVLKTRPLGDDGTRARIAARFAAQGIDAERLTLLGRLPSADSHLAAYGQIDIALDT
ncbi:MAG: tetratricopeptide repeat protein, partial [Alphaproteobacteria bacterium]